ncbi:FAD-dependent pyridine nucleotide-disulphide oxidoreductase [Nostocoides japonicum T1-X7]|uniref:FAD-dependent pyridine nucleotide-disulphide oxidoreductase n=1 Tax=Nostocoides japonicum T1-X7 TaxID=1194083 RepID=A0A077LT23_9MICO|nr:FAD/NAD(P)-binding oxidoreductase [Tetrasphaera japonica]CCH76508.1 FAD-dependent pyridine nucleotide-disulphide oxidoreductase [Tetrasphaera japonica T1-X7]
MSDAVVIVGGGLAAARTAETLREEGFDGAITIVGAEPHLPYDRPPLSKEVLQGKKEVATASLHDEAWYADHAIDVRTGTTVAAVDTAARSLTLSDGTLSYDVLVLATGSRPRVLDVPGGDLEGIHYLRTVDDSMALKEAFARGGDVVVVGAGWVGLETTAAAVLAGCRVVVLEPQPTPLYGVLGPELGSVFTALHEEHGVRFRFGEGVASFEGDAGRVTTVVTPSGARLPADTVVVGVGILPNTELAAAAGVEVDNGVVADELMRTSVDGVYAVGDVARWFNPTLGYPLRVEHWANALNTGPIAAKAIAGTAVENDLLPYFFSDQYDLGLEYSGDVPRGTTTEIVYRGDVPGREFVAFWVADGSVLAGLAVNMWDVIDDVKALVRASGPVDLVRLADPGVPLADLVP